MNGKGTEVKTHTRTGTLIGWAIVAAAIVAAALLLRQTVFRVQVVNIGSTVSGGAGPLPATGGEVQGGAGPLPF